MKTLPYISILCLFVSCIYPAAFEKLKKEADLLQEQLDSCKGIGSDYAIVMDLVDRFEYYNTAMSQKDSMAAMDALQTIMFNGTDASVVATAQRLHDTLTLQLYQTLRTDSVAQVEKAKDYQSLLSLFNKRYDEFTGTTFYQHKNTPAGWSPSYICPYIGVSDKGNVYLRFKVTYYAEDWLFLESIEFLVDQGTKFIIKEMKYGEFQRDNSAGDIYEWVDRFAEARELTLLTAIGASKTTKVRYNGQKYVRDRTLSNGELQLVRETLELYERLKAGVK